MSKIDLPGRHHLDAITSERWAASDQNRWTPQLQYARAASSESAVKSKPWMVHGRRPVSGGTNDRRLIRDQHRRGAQPKGGNGGGAQAGQGGVVIATHVLVVPSRPTARTPRAWLTPPSAVCRQRGPNRH
jgi:hypothetical protein